MISTILLAASLLTYGNYAALPTDTNSYPTSMIQERALPANVGYELLQPMRGTVTLSGYVVRTGEYGFYPGMTVDNLIGQAGSFVSPGDVQHMILVRPTPEGRDVFRLSWLIQYQRQILLHPGDKLIVPRERF